MNHISQLSLGLWNRNEQRVVKPCRFCGNEVLTYSSLDPMCPAWACQEERERLERAATRERNLAELEDRLPRILRNRGMGPAELGAAREDVTPQLWELTVDWIQELLDQPENPKGGFGLLASQGSGPGTGVGKSCLMAVATKSWAQASAEAFIRAYGVSEPSKWAPLWANWEQKLTQIREAIRDSWRSADLMDQLKEAPLLILDDLGAEQAREDSWGDTQLYAILETRYSAGRATLWTSNLTKAEFTARYSKRLVSRLFGMALPIEVPTGLLDRRLLTAKARVARRNVQKFQPRAS